jgi:predicted metal-dependent HD superfamily phosphohydrolase
MAPNQREALKANWQSLWRELGAPPDPALFQKLIDAWSEPQRHYHTLQHLGECLANFETLRHLPEHPAEVGLAIWFHDAVYDVTRHDNEARSAEWAKAEILKAGLSQDVAGRVEGLIMATCHNAEPVGIDAQVLVDIDLWILGAPPERFDEYEQQVRAEYGHVPDDVFRAGRLAILQHFLARPRLFGTQPFWQMNEQQARVNLQRSIARLIATPAS